MILDNKNSGGYDLYRLIQTVITEVSRICHREDDNSPSECKFCRNGIINSPVFAYVNFMFMLYLVAGSSTSSIH